MNGGCFNLIFIVVGILIGFAVVNMRFDFKLGFIAIMAGALGFIMGLLV